MTNTQATVSSELQQIRDILMGPQLSESDQRWTQMEQEFATLHQEIRRLEATVTAQNELISQILGSLLETLSQAHDDLQ